MPRVTEPAHQRAAGQLRKYLAKYQDIELLLQLGEYKRGTDPDADIAIEKIGPMRKMPQQSADERVPLDQTADARRRVFVLHATPSTPCRACVSPVTLVRQTVLYGPGGSVRTDLAGRCNNQNNTKTT